MTGNKALYYRRARLLFCGVFLSALLAWPAAAKASALELPYLYFKAFFGKKEDLYEMGTVLYRGGRKKEAVTWFRAAAEKGMPQAATFLADLYMDGVAQPETESEGYDVFLQAVSQERIKAQPFFCRYASYSKKHILPDARKAQSICGKSYRPLVLDIEGDGLHFARRKVYFDFHDDTYAVASAWPRFDMGVLVHDKNGNGIVDSGREMIAGRIGAAPNGFIALAAYDTNGDGILSQDDAAWHDLRIWRDAGEDATIDPQGNQELFSLEELRITSISLRYQNVNKEVNDNKVWQEGSFTIEGQERAIFAVMPDMDVVNTHFRDSGKAALPEAFKNAPNLRGYGVIKDLHDQLAEDADISDPRSLASLILPLQAYTLENAFLPQTPLEENILAVLLRWAEVDGVDPAGRGRNIDARALAYLEKISNEEFLQRGVTFDPRPQAAASLKESFARIFERRAGQLLAQTAARSLLAGSNVQYSAQRDRFYGVREIDEAALTKLVTIAKALPDTPAREIFWRRVSGVLRAAFPRMSAPRQYVKLSRAIQESDAALDAEKLVKGDLAYEHLPMAEPGRQAKKSP